MFTTVTQWFTDLLKDAGPLGGAVLLVAALVFGGTAAIKAMKAFSNQQIGQGITFTILTIVIAIIAIATFGGIMGMGKKAGGDLNKGEKFASIALLGMVPTYATYYKNKLKTAVK